MDAHGKFAAAAQDHHVGGLWRLLERSLLAPRRFLPPTKELLEALSGVEESS